MVDYTTPFASGGLKRQPTSSEVENGFTCGAAPRDLFNWLEYARQSEIGEVIRYAGITGSNSDLTQLRQAIQKIIDTALAGLVWDDTASEIDTSGFLLMTQARSRLPIYPVALTADGKLTVNAGSGQVSTIAGQSLLHRGVYQVATEAANFAHTASKIYHLRWRKDTGFGLFDLANAGYNPSSLAETDASFDSSYDDMLIARVVTDGSNASTITTLANLPVLTASRYVETDVAYSLNYSTLANSELSLNWGRTPGLCSLQMRLARTKTGPIDGSNVSAFDGALMMAGVEPVGNPSRYSTGNAKYAYSDSTVSGGRLGLSWYASAR